MDRENLHATRRSGRPEGRAWAQLGVDPPPPRTSLPLVGAWILTVVPMYFQLTGPDYQNGTVLTLLGALLVVLVLLRTMPAVGLVSAVVVALGTGLLDPLFPVKAAVVPLALAVAWGFVTGALRPRVARWPPRASLPVAAVPLAVADVALMFSSGLQLPALLIGISGASVIAMMFAPRLAAMMASAFGPLEVVGGRLATVGRYFSDRVGAPVGRVIGAVVMLPAAALTVLVWLVHRVTRYDPLMRARGRDSAWFERQGSDTAPGRAFAEVHVVGGHDPRVQLRRLVSASVVVAVLGAFAISFADLPARLFERLSAPAVEPAYGEPPERRQPTEENCQVEHDPVLSRQADWPLVICESTEYSGRAEFDASTVFGFEDFHGKWVNVTDSVRRTWSPPSCGDCTRLEVWWFGGSAAWGFFQSDHESLPSQIAKAAWERGLALDISNHAQPGWTIGQEVRRFIELSKTEDPPDVVMFYDGANDLALQFDRNMAGRGDDESEVSDAEDVLQYALRNGPFPQSRNPQQLSDRDASDELSPDEVARHAMARYRLNVALAAHFARSLGVAPIFYWQPILPTAPRDVGTEQAMTDGDFREWSETRQAVIEGLPDHVIDLADSLDEVERPVFLDFVHTSEYGARVTAQVLLDRSRGHLEQFAQGAGSGE